MTETWSALITDEHGHVLLEQEPDAVLSIASVGKLLLLIAVAERYDDAELASTRVSRSASAPVADSGLWQHLNSESLSLRDLVVLVSAVSDNWATNALLSQVGLEAVRECAVRWGMDQTQLLDIVRDERDPRDETCAPRLAQGTARELCALVRSLHASPRHSPGARLVSWLRTNTDLSLVASAIGLDPLAHADPISGVSLWNKTGTDTGVLVDVGVLQSPGTTFCYAVIVNADPGECDLVRTRYLRAGMREWGERILQLNEQ